ncbi:zinc-dependent alcohol dehydrogenase family protein [Spirosoma aureum]|uniref:alcohol dehydrogenase n=1 Tax=Spirosoma aureum TaxID=2692134 RepID=A0A6G9AS72_9BACT|nr:zinc-dependent alcohol dehydrogenase family protein [Spirosoma aureum]QIP15135.1 zinc-dependent alcohol dehydrogenase family protein [Spirosoma aureum]
MRAVLLSQTGPFQAGSKPLTLVELPIPVPQLNEIRVHVSACGVCHTELDELEGRTTPPQLPVVLGHQVVGTVDAVGENATRFRLGDRVGVAWIFSACGHCEFCQSGRENLCAQFRATGRDVNGGYADYMVVREDFAYTIPDGLSDVQAAPLLCAGAIGYRSVRLTNLQDGQRIGLTGFGASGHLMLILLAHQFPNSPVYVFARSETERQFANELGATWAGDTDDDPGQLLDAIIDTTPAWKPIVEALGRLKPGGRLVINAIRKEDRDKEYLLRLNYPEHLWQEKEIVSVANVTRADVQDFLNLAATIPIHSTLQTYPLTQANEALWRVKLGQNRGATVLVMD